MSARSTSSSSNDGVRDDVREDSQLDLQLLSPKEAFEKFDSDSSGDIDQEEFYALLEAVGIHGNHEYQEKLFRRFANKKQNTIAYGDFKRAWILLANTKDELLDRVGGTRQQLFRPTIKSFILRHSNRGSSYQPSRRGSSSSVSSRRLSMTKSLLRNWRKPRPVDTRNWNLSRKRAHQFSSERSDGPGWNWLPHWTWQDRSTYWGRAQTISF